MCRYMPSAVLSTGETVVHKAHQNPRPYGADVPVAEADTKSHGYQTNRMMTNKKTLHVPFKEPGFLLNLSQFM